MSQAHERDRDRGGDLFGTALVVLLLGAIVQLGWSRIGAVHRQRMTARPATAPRRVQRWEGEGGNVLTPQTSPDATADASA
jgi:hypothetical protein